MGVELRESELVRFGNFLRRYGVPKKCLFSHTPLVTLLRVNSNNQSQHRRVAILSETNPCRVKNGNSQPRKVYPNERPRGHWGNCPEFFEPDVQEHLQALHKRIVSKGYSTVSTYHVWQALFRLTKPKHWDDEEWLNQTWGLMDAPTPDERKQIWDKLQILLDLAPLEFAELLASLARFHAIHPRNWTSGNKVMSILGLGGSAPLRRDRRPAPGATSRQRVSILNKRFGALSKDFTPAACRKALCLEARRRQDIYTIWEKDLKVPLPSLLNTVFM